MALGLWLSLMSLYISWLAILRVRYLAHRRKLSRLIAEREAELDLLRRASAEIPVVTQMVTYTITFEQTRAITTIVVNRRPITLRMTEQHPRSRFNMVSDEEP